MRSSVLKVCFYFHALLLLEIWNVATVLHSAPLRDINIHTTKLIFLANPDNTLKKRHLQDKMDHTSI